VAVVVATHMRTATTGREMATVRAESGLRTWPRTARGAVTSARRQQQQLLEVAVVVRTSKPTVIIGKDKITAIANSGALI